MKVMRGFINIFVGLAITIFAFVGFYAEDLGLASRVPRGLIYFYCVVALLYGPFRIWRGYTDIRGPKYENRD